MYSYDKTELHPVVESVDNSAEHWKVEKITFDAAYLHSIGKGMPCPYLEINDVRMYSERSRSVC